MCSSNGQEHNHIKDWEAIWRIGDSIVKTGEQELVASHAPDGSIEDKPLSAQVRADPCISTATCGQLRTSSQSKQETLSFLASINFESFIAWTANAWPTATTSLAQFRHNI